jgi:hypothetical protein
MLERARNTFQISRAPHPSMKGKGDTKSAIGKQGQGKAYEHCSACLKDPTRPWLHGARQKLLACAIFWNLLWSMDCEAASA